MIAAFSVRNDGMGSLVMLVFYSRLDGGAAASESEIEMGKLRVLILSPSNG